MPTILAAEQAEQRRWRLRPPSARLSWFDEMLRNEFLRQFQLQQYRDGKCELRLVAAGSLPVEFLERIRLAWKSIEQCEPPPLDIAVVEEIPRNGSKFQDFTSEFFPPAGG